MSQKIGKEKKKISLRQTIYTEKNIRGHLSREAFFHALLPKGAMTLEAALVLPLFLFAVSVFLSLFLMMQAQYIVGNALERAVADTALLRERTPKEVETLTKAAFYKELAAQNCPLTLIQGGVVGFSWKNTKVDGIFIDIMVSYRIKFPVNLFGMRTMQAADSCRMHRWVGRQEGRGGDEGEEWVYVTPTQSVYHKSRNCSHLKLSIKVIKASGLKKAETLYVPCGHCTKGQVMGETVYVTDDGDCYHYRIDCSGLKRTIYMIKRTQAGGKRPCSRCGGE